MPTVLVPDLDEGSIDATLEIDLDALIPLRERKCPGVFPRQAPTWQQLLRRMYPVMRGNYEKPPLEFCNRRGGPPRAIRLGLPYRWSLGRQSALLQPLSAVPRFAIGQACRLA